MSGRIVAIIDWGSSSRLKENLRLLQQAGAAGRVKPRDWSNHLVKRRSLTLREDGSCELQSLSTAAVARRLGGVVVRRATGKVRMNRRG